MRGWRRSRPRVRAASIAVLALGLAGGAVAVPGAAQARSLPTRSVAVSWGLTIYGGLGFGTTPIGTDRKLPGPVANLTGVRQVAAGGTFSLALTSDGSVWAFGNNYYGQLGNGTLATSYVPAQVPGLTGVTQVAAGGAFSLALTSDGSVWAWGDDSNGQLGDDDAGRLGYSATPVQVSGLTGVTRIAAGGQFGLALRSDGTVWAWGRNGAGQLGNGTTNDSFVPVQVTGLSRVTQIAAGWDFAMAAATRGFITTLTSVWTWGDTDSGQLGDGTLASRSTPGQVSGIDVPLVRGISAGNAFSMVLGSDGSVWAWGADNEGQLGNAASKLLWVRPEETIGMASGITQIAAGWSHVLALRSDGTVLAWGDSGAGEIGDGTSSETTPSLPTEVTGLTGVTQVAAGFYTSLAVHNIPFFILPSASATQIRQGGTITRNN
jgi:alpha-tubulin suppressor-like RCC1 family protein